MASVFARQCLRSCTTSLSSRTLARPTLPHSSRLASFPRRHYSEQKKEEDKPPQEESKSQKEQQTPQKDGANGGEEKLKAKEAEVSDLTSRLRYLQADFLNLQRNAAREKEQTRDFAITRFASDLLETVDVLAIALKSVPSEALQDANSNSASQPSSSSSTQKSPEAYLKELHHGVEMTHRLLLQTLFKYHVKPFDPTGDQFDPNMHEALYQAPIPNQEPGKIIDCQKIGYMIKDRVLRAAQVGVVQDTS
ncbi:GrpE nucleotide exchange factor [Pluteus cervinus]|uniref:GrpE nucleotide exchange factor n=1 Tax=Pluteus cervinus TaxID=181527 RepID=A0ACD3BES8_9AGAR|nr:GrpE nucleotide exchange factor [Pluteus cervinus]